MKEYQIKDTPPVNTARLDEELKTALGALYLGVSTDGEGVRVHLAEEADINTEVQAYNIVMAHDYTQPSGAQITQAAEDARKAAAVETINKTNLDTMLANVIIADTVDELREQVMSLTQLVGKLAVAQGFTPAMPEV